MHVIEPYIAAYGSLALFLIIYLESMGAPVPGESLVVGSSVLAANGYVELVPALLAIYCGAVLGDLTGYGIGRFGGRRLLLRYGSLIRITPKRVAEFEKMFGTRDFYIVLVARFFIILRQLNGLIAGSVKMPWPRFMAANMLGAALWTLAWGTGPYIFSRLILPFFHR